MVSGIVTVILLLLFIGGWIWAWSPRRKRDFDEAARLPLAAMVPGVALFGMAHGWAHGAEGPAAGLAAYAAGFAVATLALHGVGIGAARILERGTALRALGGGTAAAGLALAMVG